VIGQYKVVKTVIGNGESILFWDDAWCGRQILRLVFPRLYLLSSQHESLVYLIWGDGRKMNGSEFFC